MSIPILLAKQSTLDELWNYTFARNIVNGLLPYKDFNMIQTPLSAYLAAIPLKIFGDYLMVMRALSLALATAIFFIFEKLLCKICNDWRLSISVTAFLSIIYAFTFSYDYNYLILFFILLTLYLEIKIYEKPERYKKIINIGIGVLAASAFLSKQSTGVFLIAAIIINCLFRKKFKLILWRLFGIVIPSIVFTGQLILSGSWFDFIDYAFIGVLSFSNSITYLDFMMSSAVNFIIGLGVIAIVIISIIKVFKRKKSNSNINLELLVLSIAGMAVVFPIADIFHFLVGLMPVLLLLFSLINKSLRINSYVIFLIATCFLFAFASANYLHLPQDLKYSSLNHFEGIRIDAKNEEDVLFIGNFIVSEKAIGNEVYVLDGIAVVYMLPLNIYHKDYDMFLRGNLGENNPQNLIDDLNSNNSVLLIPYNFDNANWQFPKEIYQTIEKQFTKTEQIGDYYVYRVIEQ